MHNEKTTIFIDGSSGTAGLRIYDRLAQREDIDLLTLPPELHHDMEAQRELINRADIAFLCLPDAAAITAADLVENPDTVVLDTSTAHRTAPGWTYGFPELSPEREAAIRTAKRIAVPGCHASGFIVLVYPLVEAGILPPDALLTCYSLTGYSGGGKKMIAEYEADTRRCLRRSWRISTAAWRRVSRSSPPSSAPARRPKISRPPTPQNIPALS